MSTTPLNGRARKSLAEQIDRLDAILDGLGEALNGAVASAVETAVQQAVRGVLQELLARPGVLRQLRGDEAPAAGARPWRALPKRWACAAGRTAHRALRACREKAVALAGVVVARAQQAARSYAAFWRAVRPLRRPILAAIVVGTAAGVAAYHGGPHLAAGFGWLGGFLGALTVQAGAAVLHLRRLPSARNASARPQ